MEITSNYLRRYPNTSLHKGFLYDKKSETHIFFTQDIYNCGAVIRNTIVAKADIELEKAFKDFCSINGTTLIYGTCSLENYNYILKEYEYEIVYQYPSNRERVTEYPEGERIFMGGTPMVMFVKHIEDPYLKGYGLYTGELNK